MLSYPMLSPADTKVEMRFAAVRQLLQQAVANGEAPSAVAAIGDRAGTRWRTACGVTRYGGGGRDVDAETVYDLASLTKVVSTLPAVLKLIDSGEISLDDRVGRFFSNAGWFQVPSLADTTVRELLTHSSGLPAWKPLFAQVSERQTGIANILQTALEHPPGTIHYSDLGFILLGAIIERVSGLRQDTFVKRYIFEPLGMSRTRYGPVVGKQERFTDPRPPTPDLLNIAATEDCGWRGRVLQGEVHDESAYVLDGIAGHAGLFGVAEDLAIYARAWLELNAPFASEALLHEAIQPQVESEDTRRGLGWLLKSPSAGKLASTAAFGHTGFTGTSLWLDPEQGWFTVLLTNRIHPSRHNGQGIGQLRADVHDAVARAFSERV